MKTRDPNNEQWLLGMLVLHMLMILGANHKFVATVLSSIVQVASFTWKTGSFHQSDCREKQLHPPQHISRSPEQGRTSQSHVQAVLRPAACRRVLALAAGLLDGSPGKTNPLKLPKDSNNRLMAHQGISL